MYRPHKVPYCKVVSEDSYGLLMVTPPALSHLLSPINSWNIHSRIRHVGNSLHFQPHQYTFTKLCSPFLRLRLQSLFTSFTYHIVSQLWLRTTICCVFQGKIISTGVFGPVFHGITRMGRFIFNFYTLLLKLWF